MRPALVAVLAPFLTGAADASSQWSPRVTNPWFPLRPGTTWIYHGTKDGKATRDVVVATSRTRVIQGAPCTVVTDRLYEAGRLEERTSDYYAQDRAGNVWYLGEDTAELFRDGKVRNREGTWLAGRNGAKPGIYFPAQPHVGQTGRQEYLKGEAEDHFRVVRVSASTVVTHEWTPLEPGVLDEKVYRRGVGTVREVTLKGPVERNILVSTGLSWEYPLAMVERVQMKTLPLLNKTADVLPAAQACCGVCRTCATTNVFALLGVAVAAVAGPVSRLWRRAR